MTAPGPITTIPPFNNQQLLPACATLCGPLYDANGACVPPAASSGAASDYTSCFCHFAALTPFSVGTADVCDSICTAGGLESIAEWFQGLCHATVKTSSATSTATSATTSSNGISSGDDGAGIDQPPSGPWISNHWQWVVMLVVLVVGIAGIWIGACLWRRSYLKKKAVGGLGHKHSGSASNPSWGPNGENSFGMTRNVRDSTRSNAPFMSSSTPVSAFEEEKPRRTEKVKRIFGTS